MDKKLNVAVIGLGYFSQFHLNAWSTLDAVSEVHVTDLSAERRAWAEQTYDVTLHEDVDALLNAKEPSIIDIIAPPNAHADLIRQVAREGRIVICQKPFCTSIAEAEEIIAYAAQVGATLIIHENFRFQPWYRTIKKVLDEGTLGTVYQCRFALRPGDGQGADAYLARQPSFREMPKFLIHETGVHFIDVFRWLFGEITDVYADMRRLNPAIKGEDASMLLLDHASGVQTLFDGNRLVDHATDNPRRTMGEMSIEGEKGTLMLEGSGFVSFRAHGSDKVEICSNEAPPNDASFGGGCAEALIAHVVDVALNGGAFENTAAEYLPVMRACDAAYLSAKERRKITL